MLLSFPHRAPGPRVWGNSRRRAVEREAAVGHVCLPVGLTGWLWGAFCSSSVQREIGKSPNSGIKWMFNCM